VSGAQVTVHSPPTLLAAGVSGLGMATTKAASAAMAERRANIVLEGLLLGEAECPVSARTTLRPRVDAYGRGED
jgi:hypothetical protein